MKMPIQEGSVERTDTGTLMSPELLTMFPLTMDSLIFNLRQGYGGQERALSTLARAWAHW